VTWIALIGKPRSIGLQRTDEDTHDFRRPQRCRCGLFRLISYSGLAIMHFFTLTRRWEGFFDPFALNDRGFPIHRNQVIDLAVMGAFIALILLIHRDHFSVGGWLRRHMGGRVWWQ